MTFRGNESGMDFQYDNRTGPMDGRSPFAQVAHNAQRFPQGGIARKRNHSAFESPQKPQTPVKQNSPSKPLPQLPAFNALFTTPQTRRFNDDLDDSSAGETPKSPERDDTPEMGWRNALSKLSFGGGANQQPQSQSQPQLQLQPQSQAGAEQGGPDAPIDLEQELHHSKERPRLKKRDSILDRIREKMSPGRRDLQRTERSGAISKGTRNKRNMELQRQVSKKRRRHSVSESEDDTRLQRNRSPRKPSGNRRNDMEEDNNSPHWISNLFTFIGQHPTVPHILSFYAQFAFNVFLLGCCAYLIYCFWSAVQGDIDKKAYEATAEILAESAACLRSWQANKCELGSRVPALEKVCEGWEACMNRDANKIGRARVSAHTFAEIFNSFVEPISWKAMAFTTIIVTGCFATTNLAFGHFRGKAEQQHQPPQHQYFPPPTPQRSFSGRPLEGYYGTPWQQPQGALEPQPSPVRRIAYD